MFGDDDDDDEYYPMSSGGGRGDEPAPPREPRLDLVPLKSALKKPRPPPEQATAGNGAQESAQG